MSGEGKPMTIKERMAALAKNSNGGGFSPASGTGVKEVPASSRVPSVATAPAGAVAEKLAKLRMGGGIGTLVSSPGGGDGCGDGGDVTAVAGAAAAAPPVRPAPTAKGEGNPVVPAEGRANVESVADRVSRLKTGVSAYPPPPVGRIVTTSPVDIAPPTGSPSSSLPPPPTGGVPPAADDGGESAGADLRSSTLVEERIKTESLGTGKRASAEKEKNNEDPPPAAAPGAKLSPKMSPGLAARMQALGNSAGGPIGVAAPGAQSPPGAMSDRIRRMGGVGIPGMGGVCLPGMGVMTAEGHKEFKARREAMLEEEARLATE
ncbi:unnamed protein product, partial [Discosporangium mesarthrocarpum]